MARAVLLTLSQAWRAQLEGSYNVPAHPMARMDGIGLVAEIPAMIERFRSGPMASQGGNSGTTLDDSDDIPIAVYDRAQLQDRLRQHPLPTIPCRDDIAPSTANARETSLRPDWGQRFQDQAPE